MRRAALAVLLAFCVPFLLFGQHRGSEGGSSSGSSSSSSGSEGNSGARSSGASETYHSSSSSSGSSSSSSSSSGGSHSSSSGSSSSSSGGSSGSSHSNSGGSSPSHGGGGSGTHPGSEGSVGTHRTTGNVTPSSNLRTGTSESSGSRSPASNSTGAGAGIAAGSHPSAADAGDNWRQQPVQFHLQNELPRAGLDQARKEGKMTADLALVGLEPTKAAYEQKMAALQPGGQIVSDKHQNWLSKLVLGDRDKKPVPAVITQARPCVVGECKPTPPPCTGKNCRPLPPCTGPNCLVPPPVNTQNTDCAYLPGAPFNSATGSGCAPLGYIDHCDRQGQCYAHLGRVNGSYCDEILERLKLEGKRASDFLQTQQAVCSAGAQDAQCTAATNDYNASQVTIWQLKTQYQMCRMASGSGNTTIAPFPDVVTQSPSGP
jgi:hypothetical protein